MVSKIKLVVDLPDIWNIFYYHYILGQTPNPDIRNETMVVS